MRTKAPDRLPLFRSDLQARLLAILILGPDAELSSSELLERVGGSRAGLHSELRRLLDAGLIERRSVGRASLYRAAADSPLLPPLRELLTRTVGVEAELRRRLAQIDGRDAAVIHGSWAQASRMRPTSDVDLLVIGRPDRDDLERAAREVERMSGRDLDLSVYEPDDWAERVRRRSAFATSVLERPWISLVGDLEAIDT
jgi:predicted nucleotidyltransferase